MQSEDSVVETPIETKGFNVLEAIRLVSEEMSHEGISKDRSNQQQGYKFRGIDDCLNALSSLLPKHGLVISPTVLERDVIERQTKSGGALFYVTVKVRFTFHSVADGSSINVVMYGEAMDSADKATNKAMSAAYKYAVLLTFCIPTEGDNDADAVTHEVAAKPAPKTFEQKFPAQPPAQAPKYSPEPNADHRDAIAGEDLRVNDSLHRADTFVWQVGKTHSGKDISEIPIDYLEWFVANGKRQDHVKACKAELQRVALENNGLAEKSPKISALCDAYLENISVSETVSECQKAMDQALEDSNINVFEQTHIKETAERKLALLRG